MIVAFQILIVLKVFLNDYVVNIELNFYTDVVFEIILFGCDFIGWSIGADLVYMIL